MFLDTQSPCHRLHPTTVLTAGFCITILVFILPGYWTPTALYLGLILPVALTAKLVAPLMHLTWKLMAPFWIFLFAIYGLLSPNGQTPWHHLGPLVLYREGISDAFEIAMRVLVMSSACHLFILLVHPSRLMTALNERNVPWFITFILISGLQLLPGMRIRAQKILEAQSARGLRVSGNAFHRARALIPLTRPLIISAFMDVEERALALEARFFDTPGKKTSLSSERDTLLERRFRGLCWIIVIAAIGSRIWI